MIGLVKNIISLNHRKYSALNIILFFYFTFFIKIYAQPYDYRFEFFGDDQGLRGTPNCLLQDSQGFIWIGTWNGLYCYDGYKFKLFKHDPADSTTISNENVNCIAEDAAGNLWVGTQNGLNKFNPFLGKSTRFYHDSTNAASLSDSHITALLIDSNHTLWIGTMQGGVNKMVVETNKISNESNIYFQHFLNEQGNSKSISNNHIYAIIEGSHLPDDVLLIGTANGFNILDKRNGNCKRYLNNKNNSNSLPSNEVKCFFKDKENSIWIGTNNGYISKLVLKQGKEISFKNYNLGIKGQITQIQEDLDGNFWIGVLHNGLFRFNKKTQSFFRIPSALNKPGFLADDAVHTILIDRNNIMWVGTRYGLNKYDPNEKMFKYYPIDAPEDLWILAVTGFCEEANGDLWVATWGRGLFKIESMSNDPINYFPQKTRFGNLNSRWITSILTDKKGIIWIGTDNGLIRFDPLNESFLQFRKELILNDSQNSTNVFIYDLFEDRNGNLWIGTPEGIIKFDVRRENFTHFLNDSNGEINKAGFYIGVIYQDLKGKFWIGANALYLFDPEKGRLKKYYYTNGNSNSSIDYMVFDIAEDRNGNLWVATFEGLFCVNSNGFIERFTQKDGLPNDHVYGILEDNFGFLWVATYQGLIKLDPVKKTFNTYQLHGNFLQNEFAVKGYYKAKDGRIYLGQAQRFTFFDPADIRKNSKIPPVIIKQIKLFNNPIEFDKPISDINVINLSHGDNMLTFDFVSLNFTNSSQNQYAYMLEGFNNDWIYCGNERYVTFTNIDPGEYVFRVKASNNDGIWNEKGASIVIIINPPWWATMWAYFIYAVIIASVLYFTWKLQLKRIRIKHDYEMSKFEAEKMHEVDELKSRFFANISHEFRTPLTLILGLAKKIVEKSKEQTLTEDASVIRRNAKRLNGLVDQLLDLSKIESGKMTLQTSPINLIPFLKGLVLSFVSFAERKRITLKFNSDEEEIVVYVDKDKIEKIITNLLSNAFKFTPKSGRIEFSVKKFNNNIEMIISDTGIGISPERIDKIFDRFYQVDSSHTREQEGTGLGLALTKELVELHKGKISVESSEGKGSTFTVTIPLGKEYLKPEEIIEGTFETEEDFPKEVELISEYENKRVRSDIEIITEERKLLLLVVEDNTDVRNYIKGNLEKEFRILEAINGEDGLNQAIKHIPDLIISDVMMPKMDGFEMCDKIKNDEKTSHIPVIITSADKIFLKKALDIINKHISDETFSVDVFADEIAMSRFQLRRKLLALVGESPSDLIRRIRLTKAAKLIEQNFGNISEIAAEVGFNNPANFAHSFKVHFGVSPSEYLNSKKV